MCIDTSGRSRSNGISASSLSEASTASVTALAEEVRGLGSNRDNSPNISPGPMTLSRFSRPSAAARVSFILPSITTYRASPSSPSMNRCSPRESFTSAICLRRMRAPSSSSPSNRGARLSTPSVLSTGPPYCQPRNISVDHGAPCSVLAKQSIPACGKKGARICPAFCRSSGTQRDQVIARGVRRADGGGTRADARIESCRAYADPIGAIGLPLNVGIRFPAGHLMFRLSSTFNPRRQRAIRVT
jgi:hypothetical protein